MLKEKVNYGEQIRFLYKQRLFKISVEENVVDSIITTLEAAGFSDKMIGEDDDEFIRNILGI